MAIDAYRQGGVNRPFIFSVTVAAGQSYTLPTRIGGVYDFEVDWGDGSPTDQIALHGQPENTHMYSNAGTYDIKWLGDMVDVSFSSDNLVVEIKYWGDLVINNGFRAFFNCPNLRFTATDQPDVSQLSDGREMFRNLVSITEIPGVNFWDWGSLTTMFRMFAGNVLFNQNLSGFVGPSVTEMYSVFINCSVFNGFVGDWDTSNVTDMSELFVRCYAFNQDISGWDVSSVLQFGGSNTSANGARGMFANAQSFNQPIGIWSINANCFAMRNMFENALLFDQDISSWNYQSVTDFTRFLRNSNMSVANYDLLLISLASQSVQSGVLFEANGLNYTGGGSAEAARNTLINTYNWTIIDGGSI